MRKRQAKGEGEKEGGRRRKSPPAESFAVNARPSQATEGARAVRSTIQALRARINLVRRCERLLKAVGKLIISVIVIAAREH